MNNFRSHIILPLSLSLYLLLCHALHPYLGYMLDSDAVAYLTISKRIAANQYLQSINGLWSPLNSWMIVPFLKSGYNAWTAAKILNCVFGAVVLLQVYFLFLRFKVGGFAQICLMIASSVFLSYAVYFQIFGDILQLIFISAYLLVLFSEHFFKTYLKAILCGMIMGIGFYAKAYTLVFFLLHFAVMMYWFYRHRHVQKRRAVISYAIGISIAIFMVLPWTFALHNKYGIWSLTGLAGKLNMSWYINSGKTFNDDITLLIPPAYEDSPSFWEDPYISQQNLSGPFSSAKHFIKWVIRAVHTCLTALQCFNEISFFALSVLLIGLYYFFFRKKEEEKESDIKIQLLLLTMVIFPSAYLMMHIETRYIWVEVFLIMIIGVVLIEKLQMKMSLSICRLSIVLFAASFMIFPILQMENLKYKNRELFAYADMVKQCHVKGSFTSNTIDAGRMWVVAYLSGNPFYTIEKNDYTYAELISEMKRYQVKYYFYVSENNKPELQLTDDFTFVTKIEGLDIYELK